MCYFFEIVNIFYSGYNWKILKKMTTHLQISSLSIEYCGLTDIEDDSFTDMPNLKKLHLEHNDLTELRSAMFSGMSSLIYLNLASNNIKAIGQDTLENLKDLHTLKVRLVFCKFQYNLLLIYSFSV